MSEFRTRRFTPVPASERPQRSRRGVRIVVTDGEAVLLMLDSDPGLPGSRWYVTPGGGIDPGETPHEAAVRELAEETGRAVSASELVGPVMTRTALHGYSDQILRQDEWFFVLRTERFTPDDAGFTDDEKVTMKGTHWVPLDALGAAGVPVWPSVLSELIALADEPARWPWAMGTVEESTLPVDTP